MALPDAALVDVRLLLMVRCWGALSSLGVGAQLSTAIIVVLGIRIFGNAAALRRHLFGA